jgi:hypothetical protein
MKTGGWNTRSAFERYNIIAEDEGRRAHDHRPEWGKNGADSSFGHLPSTEARTVSTRKNGEGGI